jgi:hypothetical protein
MNDITTEADTGTSVDKRVCDYCKLADRETECTGLTEPAVCPFGEEIRGDLTPCNCCEEQQSRCREDI